MRLSKAASGVLPLAVLLAAAGAAWAQAYPSKPIRIIHPNPAGGPSDTQFRGITPLVAKNLGQPFIIENRTGGDGIIGAEAFSRSAADGYTLALTSSQVIIGNPFIHSKLSYDVEDFAPIMHTGTFASLVVVHPSVPARSMQELIALAKQKPGTISWGVGSASPITTSILYVNWFKVARATEFFPVPYKSTTQALQAVVTGEVNLTVYAVGQAAQLAKSGKLRAIAAVGDKRSSYMPDVASLAEQGIDMNITSFFGLFARRGTPDAIIRRLNAEIRRVLDEPENREKFTTALGMNYESMTPEQFAAFLRSEREDFAKLAELLQLKKD